MALIFCVAEYNYRRIDETARHEEQSPKEKTDEALAFYTLWLMIFTGGLAFSTVGLWLTTRKGMHDQSRDMARSLGIALSSVEAAKKASDISKEALIASNRAWIRFGEIQIAKDIQFGNEEFQVYLEIELYNVGRSPALDVHVEVWPIATGNPFRVLDRHLERVQRATIPREGFGWPVTIFPNERHPRQGTRTFGGTVILRDINDASPPSHSIHPEAFRYETSHFGLYVGGCVVYKSGIGSDPETRKSAFLFSILRRGILPDFALDPNVTYQLADICLMPNILGGGEIFV